MKQPSDTQYEAVSALIQGARDHQEDAVVADFPLGSDLGLVVLSDGMGGHAAGDIASKIVMTEVYSELKFQSGVPEDFARHLPEILRTAALSANECIRAHIDDNPEVIGMGATLLAAVLLGDRLHWISIGDSPLFLYRNGELHQINEDHSMAPQIDLMVCSGMMEPEVAKSHPDRNALTSVLGGDEIPKIDCPSESIRLCDGDVLVASSDGLQFLEVAEIEGVLERLGEATPAAIARDFLRRLEDLDDPDQDNTSIAVVKIRRNSDTAAMTDHNASNVQPLLPWEDGNEEDHDEDEVRPRRVKVDHSQVSERPVRAEVQR